MSLQKDCQSNGKYGMMENEMGKENWWTPETPSKPLHHVVHVKGASQMEFISSELNSEHGILENDSCVAHVDSNSSDAADGGDDDVEMSPPSLSKKRKINQKEAKDQSRKRTKRKIYRPKVISQLFKRKKKTQVNTKDTPKPSTPKKRNGHVRRVSKCQRPLFVEDSVSFPFLKKFNDLKVKEDGSENSTIKNELGIGYNSMQSYHKMPSLSSLCLLESRQVGANFPKMCKKKRIGRERLSLKKLFIPYKFGKRKRSKRFMRKKICWAIFNSESNSMISRKMKSIIKKISSLKKKRGRKSNQLVVHKKSGELVPYRRSSLGIDIILDEETLRVWNLLTDEKGHEENDEEKRRYWEEIRKIYKVMIKTFISRMYFIQGDRRFSPWKGSVIDSVVGAFLTQNVSDHLSSSAFMTLAAKFPIKTTSYEESNEDLATPDRQGFSDPKYDIEMEDIQVEEMEAQKVKESSKVEEMETPKAKESTKIDNKGTENDSNLTTGKPDPEGMVSGKKKSATKKSKIEEEKEKLLEKQRYWDILRKIHTKCHRHSDHMDSVDWKAVRCAPVNKVAEAIASRGQHNVIAGRIQRMLNMLMDSNGSVDLEWLRYAPPKEAKEYLLSIYGLGLKSVECIRLLTLHHSAFPVDVNVGRIVVRLGWVPLQPLPESIQIHNLEEFPDSNKIQQYLWPRLCTLDQPTLYALHYQLITFGKVFCTKKNPNCNACPMRNDCKHYTSALASKRLALPKPTRDQESPTALPSNSMSTFMPEVNKSFNTEDIKECEPIIELHASFNTEDGKECEPIIELPLSPEPESTESDGFEIKNDEESYKEDIHVDNEDIEDLLTIKLSSQESLSKTHDCYSEESEQDRNMSTALVALQEDAANIPVSKMKNVSRLKTERLVYVLTDKHPLLAKRIPREPDDPSPYLLVIWTRGELGSSGELTKLEEENSQTVPGTLLIPCRTAMRGSFPLNGTYFQVNEVFADHASMTNPINVPRKWIWNLEKRIVYFGTGTSAIMRGMSLNQIHNCFWKGFVCVRAIDAMTGASRPISSILHRSTTARLGKRNKNENAREIEIEIEE